MSYLYEPMPCMPSKTQRKMPCKNANRRRRRKEKKKKSQTLMKISSCIQPFNASLAPPIANCRPILPKHTHAQKRTLAIQVRTAIPSCVIPVANANSSPVLFSPNVVGGLSVDDGINSGFSPRTRPIPATPTTVDSRNPVLVRSMRYHKTGFTSARVREACVVDSHGSRRFDS